MKNFAKFAGKKMSVNEMKNVKGGRAEQLSVCKQAAPFACEIMGGETPGTVGFHVCMREIYAGCDA
jgi:hypothetical protein